MTASLRKFGFELEYASGAAAMVTELHRNGVMQTAHLHDYHCTCPQCMFTSPSVYQFDRFHECTAHCDNYGCFNDDDHDCGSTRCPRRTRMGPGSATPADLRAQRDSTADGEFITRPLNDWDDLRRITAALTTAATNAGAHVTARCGLHVHVDTSDDLSGAVDRYGEPMMKPNREQLRRIVPAAYLAYERYFTEIVAPGSSIQKRDMNSTLMQATRQWVSDGLQQQADWMDIGRAALDDTLTHVIARDRHVDLNWSRRHSTWEFRVFNATNAAWRIELACRIAVAFVEATPVLRERIEATVKGSKFWPVGCDSPWGEIIRPAYSELAAPHPTKRPIVPINEFIDILCNVDPDLRPLIERQANYMRTRYATDVRHAS